MRPGIPVVAVAVLVVLAGCGDDTSGPHSTKPTSSTPSTQVQRGAPATWQLIAPDPVDPATRRLTLGVTRLSCAGGRTGEVLQPQVTYEANRILIRSDVAPLSGGAYTCQGNDVVRVEVLLNEPVGQRELVDAACLDEAVTTAPCAEL